MNYKEEIEFVHEQKTCKDYRTSYRTSYVRDYEVMEKVMLEATNTYTDIMPFVIDYKQLYNKGLIVEGVYYSAINDLYLLSLIILERSEKTNKSNYRRKLP